MLPLVREGQVWTGGDANDLHDHLTIQMYAAAIPGLTIPRAERVRSALDSMRDVEAGRSRYQMTDHMIGRLTEYFGGTHVIEFDVSGGGDADYEVNMVLEKPDGDFAETTMTAGPEEQYLMSARAVGWILENSGIDLDESELARARTPLWGDDIP